MCNCWIEEEMLDERGTLCYPEINGESKEIDKEKKKCLESQINKEQVGNRG